MTAPHKVHPHDVGLPEPAIRKRRRSRRFARIMITFAFLTAIPGWPLLLFRMKDQAPYQAIVAYALLIVSSITLVLGLWYLLLAQVERVARIVEADDTDPDPAHRLCPNCGWFFDPPDRYCRHCGKPLGTSIAAPNPNAGAP
jgi:hypothetical protein